MYIYPKKQPSNSNIYIESAQIILKVEARYVQNEEFALYISKINKGMKQSFHMWVGSYRSNLLI